MVNSMTENQFKICEVLKSYKERYDRGDITTAYMLRLEFDVASHTGRLQALHCPG